MADLNVSQSDLEEIFGIKLVGKGTEVPKEMVKDFVALGAELRETGHAADQLSDATQKLDTSLKTSAGKDESGGLGGLAGNALKAERAINMLVSGHGLARAAPLLEGLLGVVGGPAGLGAAFVALELGARVLVPTLEKFAGAVTGEQVDNLKKFAEYVKKLREEGEKLAANPAVSATSTAAKHFLEHGAGNQLRGAMIAQLRQAGEGLNAAEKEQMKWWHAHRDEAEPQGKMGEWWRHQRELGEAAEKKNFAAATQRSLELLARLGEGGIQAQAEVEKLLGEHGRTIMQKMRDRMRAAALKQEQEAAAEEFIGPPAPRPKTVDEKRRQEIKELVEAEDRANQKARGAAATPQFLKDVERRTEALIGDGWNDRKAALNRAITDAQETQRDRAEAEAKRGEREAITAEMRRRGFHGSPEQWEKVAHNALKDLPMTAGNIVQAVQMGYMEAVRQMRMEAHKLNREFGNSFQQMGSPW